MTDRTRVYFGKACKKHPEFKGERYLAGSPQFTHYTEDSPVNWQEGFVILHFRNGKFTGPELVHVMPDGRVLFRGEELKL